MGFVIMNRQWYNPVPPGRVIPNSYIPNIRPQVDVNLFISIFQYLGKILLHFLLQDLVTHHYVISWNCANPP